MKNNNHHRLSSSCRSQALRCLAPLVLALGLGISSFAAAQADPRYEALQVASTEATVLWIMQTAPIETTRTTVAGVEKKVMVFSINPSRYTVTFIAGRLVAKTVEARPTSALKLWPF